MPILIGFHEYASPALTLALWLAASLDKAPWLPGRAVNVGPAQTKAVGLSAYATMAASTPKRALPPWLARTGAKQAKRSCSHGCPGDAGRP